MCTINTLTVSYKRLQQINKTGNKIENWTKNTNRKEQPINMRKEAETLW